MSSGSGGGGNSSASGTPSSTYGAVPGASTAGGAIAGVGAGAVGAGAGNAIDLTTDDNRTRGQQRQGQAGGSNAGGNAQEEELRKKVRYNAIYRFVQRRECALFSKLDCLLCSASFQDILFSH